MFLDCEWKDLVLVFFLYNIYDKFCVGIFINKIGS